MPPKWSLFAERSETGSPQRNRLLGIGQDRTDESAYRQLMRLYALYGDRARALRVYHTCVTTLRRELSVEPSSATRETYQRLLDADATSEQAPLPLIAPETGRRLLGRQLEWKTMQAAWRSAANIQAHCVIVSGVAGIGKTRLLEEMLESMARQGIVTASTRCYAAEGRLAYAPVAEWLRSDVFRTHLMGLEPVWLAQAGGFEPSGYVESSGPAGGEDLILPPKVYAVIQYRLAQLSAQARDLVDLAAIIGRDFTYEVLAQASGQDEDTLVRGLDELWQRQIIRERGADAYDFSHDKIRDVACREILSARQKLYHRRVAQALEIVRGPALDTASGQIAFHFEQAGLFWQAIGYYRRAAEAAQHLYANEEAIALYTRAVEVSRQITPAVDAVELLPIYEGRGLVWNSLAKYEQAIADLQIMCQLARDTGNRQKVGESLCHLAYAHWLMFSEKEVPFVRQYAQEAMELATRSGEQKILARSLTMLGAVDQVHRDLAEAGQKFEAALAIGRRPGHTDALVQTLAFLSLQTYLQGDFQATVRFAREGVDGSRLIQDGLSELRILAFLCQATWSLGHYTEALAMVNQGMAHAKERGNTFIVGRLLNTLGWFHSELGDFSKAIEDENGNGSFSIELDFPILNGAYPFQKFEEFDAEDERYPIDEPRIHPVAIVGADAPFTLRLVSHCTDGVGHGLLPGAHEGWFQWKFDS